MRTPQGGKRVMIVGASGELGGAIARIYATSGAQLVLWGRDVTRLDRLSNQCIAAGAKTATTLSLDLMDMDLALACLARDDDAAPFDIVVFAAGLGDIRVKGECVENPTLVARLGIVNYVAPAAMAAAFGQRMADRKHGSIVLIGSAAAFHALPFACAYSSSKAGLTRFGEALRINLRPLGVSVTLVSPGFIDTAAARKIPGPKPLMLSPEKAAARIVKAAARGEPQVVMPSVFSWLRLFDRALPRPIRDRLLLALTPPGR